MRPYPVWDRGQEPLGGKRASAAVVVSSGWDAFNALYSSHVFKKYIQIFPVHSPPTHDREMDA